VADFIGNSNLMEATVVSVGPEATVVRTERGMMLHAPPHARNPGDHVVAMIRPELVRLAEPKNSRADNVLQVRIVAATYLGQDLHLRVRCGEELLTMVAQGTAL